MTETRRHFTELAILPEWRDRHYFQRTAGRVSTRSGSSARLLKQTYPIFTPGLRGDESWYITYAPTLHTAARTFYVDAANGSDSYSTAQAQNSATPWLTLTKARAVMQAGDRFYLSGTFTDQYLSVPAGLTSTSARVAWVVWPGRTAIVKPRVAQGVFEAPYYCTGKGYGWVEGITLDAREAYSGYAAVVAVSGATGSPNTVFKDVTVYGSVQVGGPSENFWFFGGSVSLAGNNGYHHGPQAGEQVTATTNGAGNLSIGAYKYVVVYRIENSPSSTVGALEYSLPGYSSSQVYWPEGTVTTTTGQTRVAISNIPKSPNAYCTGRLLYRTTVGGDYTTYKLVALIPDNTTTTYDDNVADASLGAALPSPSSYNDMNTGEGINFYSNADGAPHRFVVYNATIGNCGHIGLAIGYSGTPTTLQRGRIGFNTFQNEWTAGFSGAFTERLIIENNLVKNSGKSNLAEPRWVESVQGLIVQGYRTICRFNRITGSYGQALFIQGNTFAGIPQHTIDCQIIHNSIWGNYGHGILLNARFTGNVANNLIANNLCWNNCLGTGTWQGFGLYNGIKYDIWVQNNDADSSLKALWYSGGNRLLNGNVFKNNLVGTGSTNTFVWYGAFGYGGDLAYTDSAAAAAYPTGWINQKFTDPNVSGTDPNTPATFLFLSTGSGVANSGVVIPEYGYLGSAPTIGAYELAA